MDWKLWSVDGRGLWLPISITLADMASAVEERERGWRFQDAIFGSYDWYQSRFPKQP